MFASERAAFFTSSNTCRIAGLAPMMFSNPRVCWSCPRRLRFSIWRPR